MADTKLDPILSYLEPIPAMAAWDKYLDKTSVERLIKMHQENNGLCRLIFSLQPYSAMVTKNRTRLKLPLSEYHPEYTGIPKHITSIKGYRELYLALEEYINPILFEFRQYRDKAFKKRDTQN